MKLILKFIAFILFILPVPCACLTMHLVMSKTIPIGLAVALWNIYALIFISCAFIGLVFWLIFNDRRNW